MIKCLDCYRCKKIDTVVYCPFFDVQPCHRGMHEVPQPPPKKKMPLKIPNLRNIYTKYHADIFRMLNANRSLQHIALALNLNVHDLSDYIERVEDYNLKVEVKSNEKI